MTAYSLGKGAVSPSTGTSLTSMPWERDPEVMKLFIRPQSLNLCLSGKAWFGQVSSRSFSKWSMGSRAWCFLLPTTSTACPTLKSPARSLIPKSSSVATSLQHSLCLFLPPLAPSSVSWMAIPGEAPLQLLGAGQCRATLVLMV
jgi:hypothetical protein